MNFNSTMDFGLTKGIRNHWKQELLVDYTIVVEDREFKVHKLVLASVSDYFEAMICGSMKESETDRVELKGLSPDAVSKLIDLIYTEQYDILTQNTAEILECAVYFQMPAVILECRKILLDKLSVDTCCHLLSMCQLYSFDAEVKAVKSFIKSHLHQVVDSCKLEDMSYEGIQGIIDGWGLTKYDWELFQLIKHWVQADYDSRKVLLNDLMSQVRFCLLEPCKLDAIKKMNVFTESDGSWQEFVRNAERYHKLPSHHKVLDESKQSQLRGDAIPVYFVKAWGELWSSLYFKRNAWFTYSFETVLEYRKVKPVVLELNNFVFICTGHDKDQVWHIFDPRNESWDEMAGMLTPKTEFALVHHDNKLYALGGHLGSCDNIQSMTAGVEQYDLSTGTWSALNKMPAAVAKCGACVYDGCIYVSGGMWQSKGRGKRKRYSSSADLDCLNTASGAWEKKAAMSKKVYDHKMHVMTLHNLKVIVVIDQGFNIMYYHPPTDQWSTFTPEFSPADKYEYEWCDESVFLAKDNSVFLVNVSRSVTGRSKKSDDDHRQRFRDCAHDDDNSDSWSDASDDSAQKETRIILQWTFPENGHLVSEESSEKCIFPGLKREPAKDFFGVFLSVPMYMM